MVGALKTKYNIHTVNPEEASFDNLVKLLKLKFHQETAESLVECIRTINSGSGSVIIKHRDIIFDLSPDCFYLKLHQTIADIYKSIDDYKIDTKYIHVLNVCLASTSTFQHFYRHTALLMVKHLHPLNIQKFLDQFIFDVRIRQTSRDIFCRMYVFITILLFFNVDSYYIHDFFCDFSSQGMRMICIFMQK